MLHPMAFAPLPETASWQHEGLRTGFEVAYFQDDDGASKVEGCTTAVEDGRPSIVHYDSHCSRPEAKDPGGSTASPPRI
jgi:hypothetical protein